MTDRVEKIISVGPPIKVGDKVRKREGYRWPGVVVAHFQNLAGSERFVVECTVPEVAGALHIYNRNQLELGHGEQSDHSDRRRQGQRDDRGPEGPSAF